MGVLTAQELLYLHKQLGREANSVEREIVGAEWSEHCSYKSSKKYLRTLPTRGDRIVVGPGYDAGVLDVGEGYVVTVHIESHNHPSAVEPFGGAATGVGGILRDIISMGTRPIAVLNALRFGSLEFKGSDSKRTKSGWLFKNVVRGIADYGNCIGIPDVGGEVEFDDSFSDYCLVDVASVGFGKKSELIRNTASVGDLLVLVGGATGKDGIHGASFASSTLIEENRSAVQIPDPFLEKLLLEATIEATRCGILKAIKDLGGGGLACCLSETSDSVGLGFEVDLTNLHVKEEQLTPSELMISESQERMLFIIDPSSLAKLREILAKYELNHSKLGQVASHKDLVIKYDGEIIARMPAKVVAHAPLIDRPSRRPEYLDQLLAIQKPSTPPSLSNALLYLLGTPSISSKRWVFGQFDFDVGIRTVLKPGESDAAALRLDNGKLLTAKLDGNSKHCYLDPYYGVMGCMSEGLRNTICAGGEPIGIVDHLQFASPEDPEIYWTFRETIRGIVDYCNYMRLPVVGGKVSFYNETTNGPIKPSPVIGTLGLIDNPGFATRSAPHDGDTIFLVGSTAAEMGGSEYYESYHSLNGGRVPRVKLSADKKQAEVVKQLIHSNIINCAHDCSKGGLAVALGEMVIASACGMNLTLDSAPREGHMQADELLFSESNSRYLLGTSKPTQVEEILAARKVPFAELGHVSGDSMRINFENKILVDVPLSRLEKAYFSLENLVS